MVTVLKCLIENDYEGCKTLIESGIDINEKLYLNNTVIHYSINNIKILELLLSHGGDPNCKNIFGSTPLHRAIMYPESIPVLIRFGADMEIKDQNGWTPMWKAMYDNNIEALKILLSFGSNPYNTTFHGINVVDYAKIFNMDQSLKIFTEWDPPDLLIKQAIDET